MANKVGIRKSSSMSVLLFLSVPDDEECCSTIVTSVDVVDDDGVVTIVDDDGVVAIVDVSLVLVDVVMVSSSIGNCNDMERSS